MRGPASLLLHFTTALPFFAGCGGGIDERYFTRLKRGVRWGDDNKSITVIFTGDRVSRLFKKGF